MKDVGDNLLQLRTCGTIDGLVQDCGNSIAYELELLQSSTETSKYVLALCITSLQWHQSSMHEIRM